MDSVAPPPREPTADGRHIVIDGRRWRATDPSIPEPLRQTLVDELMAARRAIGTARRRDDDGATQAESAARQRVHDAKIALGERGDPWWDPTPEGNRSRIAAATRALLRRRKSEASICPSEVARIVGGAAWRDLMPTVRQVAGELVDDDRVVVTQGADIVDPRTAVGPIRIRRSAQLDETMP